MMRLPSSGSSDFSTDRKPTVGDDAMVSGISGFGNEEPAKDDQDVVDKEEQVINRLRPALTLLNEVIQDEIDDATSIKTLIIGSPNEQPDPGKILIELRARELHLNFLERFKARIQNTQNTIDEINNNG